MKNDMNLQKIFGKLTRWSACDNKEIGFMKLNVLFKMVLLKVWTAYQECDHSLGQYGQ